MNSDFREPNPVLPDTNWGYSQQRWRDQFARWVMVGILAVFTLGGMMPIASLAKDDGKTIDVMVLYTSYLATKEADKYGDTVAKQTIENMVAETNTTFEESGVKPRLNLVHFEKVDYDKDGQEAAWGNPPEPEKWEARLAELKTDSDGILDQVHAMRDKYLADVVVLLVYTHNKGYRGVAYQMKTKDLAFESSAFAVVRAREATSTYGFASKLGHIMGCAYDKEHADKEDTEGVYSYSYGYKLPTSDAKICSIMAENTQGLEICLRYNGNGFWSNPNKKREFGGKKYPTGTKTANCVGTLNKTAYTVANFRYPDPGKLQFSVSKNRVDENVGNITLTVTRINNGTESNNKVLYGKVSVDVEDVTATDSKVKVPATVSNDYTFTSPITLTWDEWDADSKEITVPIIDDTDMESTEKMSFVLANLVGEAKLGSRKTHRVEIKDNDTASIAYVIDITSSMDEEIAAVRDALTDYTKKLGKRKTPPRINFVTFRDKVHKVGITNDLDTVQTWISKLIAAGGNDCPEASVQALKEAGKNLKDGGTILLVTDAAPHTGEIDDTITDMKAKRRKLNVKLTDDCESSSTKRGDTRRRSPRDGSRSNRAQEVFPRIAFETGGSFVFMPEVNNGSALNAAKLKNSIFNTMVGTDEPAIIDIAPTAAFQGGTLSIIVNGSSHTNFNKSTSVTVEEGSIVINQVVVISATQLMVNLTVPAGVTPDLYSMTVTTRLGSETEVAEGVGILEVVQPRGFAEVLSVTPFSFVRGTSATVEISGFATDFDETSTLSFGNGITLKDYTVNSPTLITATINISSATNTGLQRVLVKTGRERAGLMNAFLVLSDRVVDSNVPKISAITPAQGARGTTLKIEISGKNTNFLADEDDGSFLYFSGTGMDVLSLEVKSATSATAIIAINSETTFGYRDMVVETGDEVAVILNGFEISADLPEITLVKPNYGFQGETLGVAITGIRTNFVAGKSVIDIGGNNIAIMSTTVNSPTQMTANFQVGDYADLGWRNLSILTGSEVVSLYKGFDVIPEITPLGDISEENDLYQVWGRIFDENGNPIAGVIVQIGNQTATTDDAGNWEISDLSQGVYTAGANKKLFTFTSPEVTLGDNLRTEVKIMVNPPGTEYHTAYGTITDADGNALAGVSVQVDGDNTVETDADGKWEITDLLKGDYSIVASKEGYSPVSQDVTLESKDFRTEVTLTLSKQAVPNEYTVYGTITDADGNAVAGVTVRVGDNTVVTDADGKWEITGLSEGSYSIIASKDGFTFTQQNVTVQEVRTEVKLEPTMVPLGIYRAFGTIKDKFKAPIDGVMVQVYAKNAMSAGPVATTVTDAAGNWEVTTLFEGEYTVVASKDGYIFKTRNCFASENQACEPNLSNPDSVLNLTVAAQPKSVIQGENVTYIVTVTNMSDSDSGETATNIVVSEELAENAKLVSMDGNCSGMTCTLSDLAPGDSANMTIVVSNDQVKTLSNTVIVTSEQFPADKETTRTKVLPYFSVSVNDQPDPVAMGGVLQYTVNVALSSKAPSAATGVKLELLLPNGVELQAVNSDSAMCDTGNLPTLTCSFADIEQANGAGSVNIDVELKDLGLLVLTLEAKLSANEYPTHSVRERTYIDIPANVEVDIAFVVDVTGSMQEEINSVVGALKKFIATIDPNDSPLIALVTFKDNVTYSAFTRDMTVLLTAIDKLKAKGGGACPEAAVEALKDIAIPHVKQGGDILFATDASPYADADVDGTLELLLSKGIRFNAMITGDCSKESSWNLD